MPASLPTENAVDKAVNEFGIGTYDSDNGISDRGEDTEGVRSELSPNGKSLPDDGGGDRTPPFGNSGTPEVYLSYPQSFSSTLARAAAEVAVDMLPGDIDGGTDSWNSTKRGHPDTENYADPIMTAAKEETSEDSEIPSGYNNSGNGPPHSGLPQDSQNPTARSDYYDRQYIGSIAMDPSVWADEDTGAYAGEEDPGSQLPGVTKNNVTMENWLGALGNFWSGTETEDVSGPQGSPTEDFNENIDFDRSDNQDGGKIISYGMDQATWNRKMDEAMKIPEEENKSSAIEALYKELPKKTNAPKKSGVAMSTRFATNLALVTDLTEAFIKEFGKKDLTKRCVLAFLQKRGEPQYLSSDIIRCLKVRHSVFVKDVLDEFPVQKTASVNLASVRNKLIDLEIQNVRSPEVASKLRRCAASLSLVLADLERLEGKNG